MANEYKAPEVDIENDKILRDFWVSFNQKMP